MRSASPFMSAYSISRLVLALLLAGAWGLAPAQDRINIEELQIRSAAGERSATRQLAEMYYLGRGGVEQNFSEAARWYEKLAKQGDARAQTSLGLMYARGYGVEKNMETARRWWSFAAAQNDPGAQYNLGLVYSRGEGVAQDHYRAAQWLDRAAQRGHIQAQHNLGLLYHEGKGLERDSVRAYFWLKVATLQGDDGSHEALKTVGGDMSAEQIRQAEDQAQEWMKRLKRVVGK
jgi:TPR repeat protein